MRTLISAFAGLALLAGVSSVPALAGDVQSSQPQSAIAFTAGQGGSMSVVLPANDDQRTTAGPAQAVAVAAGQAGNINVIVPGPSVDVVARAPAANPNSAQVTLLPND